MNYWVQYLAAVMGMASTDCTKDVAHLIHYWELFVFIVCHCLIDFWLIDRKLEKLREEITSFSRSGSEGTYALVIIDDRRLPL